jgi:proteic killer suppression protein
MITGFRSKHAEDIFNGTRSKQARKIPPMLHEKCWRLFDQINASSDVDTLRVPPGNRLEKLKGSLQGYWSLRVNNQWRIIFKWNEGNAYDVDIVDYH